jgi:hypothetical protein
MPNKGIELASLIRRVALQRAWNLALLQDMDAMIVMDTGRAAAIGTPGGGCMLTVFAPYNEEAATPGNGNMVSIALGSKALVDLLHAKALELGGVDEGALGQRMEGFYRAYFRDVDGNKIFFCHFG